MCLFDIKGEDGGAGMVSVIGPRSDLTKLIFPSEEVHLDEHNPKNQPSRRRGGFSVVKVATWDNRKVIVKMAKGEAQDKIQLKDEADFYLKPKLKHVNIPVILAALTENSEVRALIFEHSTQTRDLEYWIEDKQLSSKLDLDKRLFILFQVVQALAFMHLHKHIHRDVKPRNVIVHKNMRAQVIDFGLAREASSDSNTIQTQHPGACTPQYGAPEQLANIPKLFALRDARAPHTKTKIDDKVDVLAFGLLLFFVVTGEHFHISFKHRTRAYTWGERSEEGIREHIKKNIDRLPGIGKLSSEALNQIVHLVSELVFLCVGGKNKARNDKASDLACDRPTMEEVLSMMMQVQDFRNHQGRLQNREAQYTSDTQTLAESQARPEGCFGTTLTTHSRGQSHNCPLNVLHGIKQLIDDLRYGVPSANLTLPNMEKQCGSSSLVFSCVYVGLFHSSYTRS
eukprot:g43475.t1